MDSSGQQAAPVNVAQTLAVLWHRAWFIIGLAVLFGAVGAVVAYLTPKKYDAIIVLMPTTDDSTSGKLSSLLSGGLGQMGGGLMSLAGLSTPGQTMKAQALATLQSEILTEQYIRDNDLLPVLFKQYWDPQSRRWTTSDPDKLPTLWKGNMLFKKKIRDLSDDARAGVVTMTVRWRDPKLAAKWANDLVNLTNVYMRNKAIAESERSIAYLNGEVAKTNVVELRTALFSLIESEVKKEMLARGNDEYALKIIDPAVAPERPTFPRPVLWTFLGVLLGGIIGVIAVLARHSYLYGTTSELH